MENQSQSSGNDSGNPSKDTKDAARRDAGLEQLTQGLARDAGELGDGLKTLASSVADDAKSAVESQVSTQKNRLAEGLGGVAQALRQMSRGQEAAPVAPALTPYLEQAARQAERASDYFDEKSLGEVARDVESFARREPALFLGGAFVLGLVGGRFLKAAQPATSEGQRERGDGYGSRRTMRRMDPGGDWGSRGAGGSREQSRRESYYAERGGSDARFADGAGMRDGDDRGPMMEDDDGELNAAPQDDQRADRQQAGDRQQRARRQSGSEGTRYARSTNVENDGSPSGGEDDDGTTVGS